MKSFRPALRALACLALASFALPAEATHAEFTVTRSPVGPVFAGRTVTVTANVKNTSEVGLDLTEATINTALLDPHLTLIPGTVETRYVENDVPVGTIVRGNDPLDREVFVELDPVPPTWTAQVRFQLVVAGFLPAGKDDVGGQVFLTFCHENCQSIPWFVIIPVIAQPLLDLDKTDFGATVLPGQGVTYTLTAENIGTQEATGLTLTDTVPFGARFDPTNSHPDWTCSPNHLPGALCKLTFDSLGTQPRTFPFAVITDPPPVPAGVDHVHNQAELQDDGTDADQPRTDTATDFTPLLAFPDLSISKTDGGAVARPESRLAYTLAYDNTGTQDATGVVLRETVPEHTQFEPGASSAGWTCSPSAGPAGATCTLAVGGLPVGGSGTAAFATTVASVPAGVQQLINTVEVADDGTNGADLTPGDNQATETSPLAARPDLRLTKDDGGVAIAPGETVAYTLTFANVGSQGAEGVLLRETVPAHATFDPDRSGPGWSCNPAAGGSGATCTLAVGSLAAGASASTAFALIADKTLSAGVEELTNVATVEDDGANGEDPTPGNNRASETTPIDAAPDLSVRKDDGGAVARPGEVLLYSIEYANHGEQTATGAFLREWVPEHASFASGVSDSSWLCGSDPSFPSACVLLLGNLQPGETGIATFAVRVDPELPAGLQELTNRVEIGDDGANGPDADPEDNEAVETTPLEAAPDLVVVKDDGDATARPGDTVVYTLEYRNAGTQGATGVVLGDTVPEHTRFAPGESAPGWVCDPSAGGPGATCLLDVGELAAGASGSAAFAVVLDAELPAGVEEIVNVTLLRDDDSNGDDPNPDDDGDEETTPVEAAPDLVLVKDDGGVTARPGDTIVYTLEYRNTGTQGATGVVLGDTVPEHTRFAPGESAPGWVCDPSAGGPGATCLLDVGELAAGASGSAAFAVVLDAELPVGVDEIVNVALLRDDDSNGDDPNPDDDGDDDSTPVEAGPDLVLSKDDGGASVQPGQSVTYELTYRNVGDQTAQGVVLEDSVPEHAVFVPEASDPGWSCPSLAHRLKPERIQGPKSAHPTCTLSLGELAPGASGTAAFTVRLDAPLAAGVDRLTNTALLRDDGVNGDDPTPENNQASDTTPVEADEDDDPGPSEALLDLFLADLLAEDRDASETVTAGDVLSYSVEVVHAAGELAARNPVVVLPIPEHTSYVPDSVRGVPGVSGSPAAGRLRVALPDLAPGDRRSFVLDVLLDAELPEELDEIRAQGTITAEGLSSHPSDDPDTALPDDPTVTPLGQVSGPGVPLAIPTLGEYALALLALLLLGAAWRALG